MKTAVLGSGNGGLAVAADCALHGHEVRLFDFEEFPQNIAAIRMAGGIKATGDVKGFAKLEYVGHSISQAVNDAELIYVVGPSYSHLPFAKAYKGVMEDGQKVIICPGTNGGALLFKKELGKEFVDPSVIVAETSTLPYACRILEPGEVHVYLKLRAGLFIASLPSSGIQDVFKPFEEVYPGSTPYRNVFQTILQNGNNVIHPAVSLLNVGRIESPEDFYFYEDGVTPSVGRMMKAVDEERLAIAKAMDIEILSEPEAGFVQGYMLEKNYDTGYSQAPGFKGIKAQTQVDYRYFTEDVGYGLVLLTDIARKVGVDTPVMDALITLVSVVLVKDYKQERQRTLDSFGMGHLSGSELLKHLE
jgi:opine dehydrogenase